MTLSFKTPSDKEFQQICIYIRKFELDNRGLEKDQFTAVFLNDQLAGFGRLREHDDCIELCSLGVIETYRRQGIGKALVHELIKRKQSSIYLACIIPEFFTPFGFKIVKSYPLSMQNKFNYCTQELVVPETYVVMLLDK